ncbi:MAG TPA: hypothetical protein ENN69_06225 [Spirochaetia bacterium]|nr:hypothetical protein [Spirochaetia bacterium]
MRKLSRNEKVLLFVLSGSVFLCLLFLFLVLRLPEIDRVRSDIALLEESIRSIKSLEVNEKELTEYHEALKTAIQLETSRYVLPEERDLTRLSLEMLALLKKHRLSYNRLGKVNTRDGMYIEISISGALINVVGFLEEVYRRPKYLNIYFLTLNNRSGAASAVIRMNYGEITGLPD